MPKGALSEKAKQSQQVFQDKLNQIPGTSKGYYKLYGSKPELFNVFPEAEKKEIESMKVDLPEGITEEDFMTAVMGAMSGDERMSERLTSSSKYGSDYDFNHVYMTDNLVKEGGDKRFSGFEKVCVDGRKKAIQAVEEYKKGNKEPLQKYQKQFLEGMKTQIGRNDSKEKDVTRHDMYWAKLAYGLLQKPEFEEMKKDNAIANMYNQAKQLDYTEKNIQRKKELIEEMPEPKSKEREDKLVDIVLGEYIMTHYSRKLDVLKEQNKADFRKTAEEWGYTKKDDDFVVGNFNPEADGLANQQAKNNVDGIDMMLMEEGGYEKVKELYAEEIKQTPLFQMLNEADEDMLGSQLETATDTLNMLKGGFKDFRTKVPPQYEEQANKRNAEAAKTFNREAEKEKILAKLKPLSDKEHERREYNTYEVASGDEEFRIKESLEQINDIFKDLDNADPSFRKLFAGNQEKFKAVKESLKELNEFAKNMDITPGSMDFNRYNDLSRNVEKAATEYLDYKKEHHTDSSYEKKRIKAVDKVKNALQYKRRSLQAWNERQLDNADTKIMKDINAKIGGALKGDDMKAESSKRLKKIVDDYKKDKPQSAKENIGMFSTETRKVFYGGDYSQLGTKNSYSATRGAIVSISLMAMAATGKYSIEDLMDNTKFTEEKRKMGEEVVQHYLNGSHEDQKWIAGNMIEGQKKMVGMVNDFCAKNDILADGFEQSPEFNKIVFSSELLFDTYQELDHCKDEGDEYLKETQPDAPYKTTDELRGMVEDKMRPIATIVKSNATTMKHAQTYLEKGKFTPEILQTTLQSKMMKDLLKEKREQNPGKPITELLTPVEIENELVTELVVFNQVGPQLAYQVTNKKDMGYGHTLDEIYMDKIADGSIYDGMKIDRGAMKVENAPTPGKLSSQYRFDILKRDREMYSTISREVNDKSFDFKSVEGDGPQEIARSYTDTVRNLGQKVGYHLYTDKRPEYKDNAKQYVKEQMALNLCEKCPDKFKNASKEEILKGVEQFPGYKNLEANIDKMGIEEVADLWQKDVTSDIINKTIEKQMKEIEKKNNQPEKVNVNTKTKDNASKEFINTI